ncbi:hypothetical protein EVAR_24292_1 [Eumeta japonica]|uniref:Uncharacterized protein n=1 Tax=Eumeta variegata TaxID=151549 RepID=A0A4C1VF19_EUMVA|nr:hypothetical protein EVAR_24292_1 [Eumeta japonica]
MFHIREGRGEGSILIQVGSGVPSGVATAHHDSPNYRANVYNLNGIKILLFDRPWSRSNSSAFRLENNVLDISAIGLNEIEQIDRIRSRSATRAPRLNAFPILLFHVAPGAAGTPLPSPVIDKACAGGARGEITASADDKEINGLFLATRRHRTNRGEVF